MGSQYHNISIGKIGCHQDCKTCNGFTSLDCLSCDINSERIYLYSGQCLTKCPDTAPYSFQNYDEYEGIVLSYECVAECPIGYFASNNECVKCNSLCKSCSSNDVMSCLECNNYNKTFANITDFHNIITSPFIYKGMCQTSCPFEGTVLYPD